MVLFIATLSVLSEGAYNQPTAAEKSQPSEGKAYPRQETESLSSKVVSYLERQWRGYKEDKRHDNTVKFATIATLGVLIFHACIYRRQANIMQVQSDALHQQRADSIAFQRAFITIMGVDHRLSLIDARQITQAVVEVHFQNNGNTPARNVTFWSNQGSFDRGMPDDFDFPAPPGASQNSGPIGPKAPFSSGIFPISDPDLKGLIGGTKSHYIWGRCEYDDIFIDTERHWISFCYQVEVINNFLRLPYGRQVEISSEKASQSLAVLGFKAHSKGNGSD